MNDLPTIRILAPDDALAWRALRIEMLTLDPEGFHADLAEAKARTESDWRAAIPALPDALFGLFAGVTLAGSAWFKRETVPKLAHKGWMLAVYVTPGLRGQGWGRKLVRAVIGHAREHVDVLLTGASLAGAPVYKAEGFETYGIERDASRVNGQSIDDELMAIHFRNGFAR
ncbi:MAG: GNAT family N-acetyltransferase [Croceibacterium sp.]